jgi:Fe-S-cluster-containing hydrogenase component 2
MSPCTRSDAPDAEALDRATPSKERLARGPVAVLECFQRIPCDPCVDACKHGAIRQLADINDLPTLDLDLCNGCGTCVASCPGLAIFVVDATYSQDEALVQLPYEFLPLPAPGDLVTGLGRGGEVLGAARVIKVRAGKALDRTAIISVAVPHGLAMKVRNIRLSEGRQAGGPEKQGCACRGEGR